MKRNFLVLAVLALTAVALTTADASAWGWWRYRAACHTPLFPCLAAHWGHGNRPYNAFTPNCGGNSCCNACGHRAGPWIGGAAGCNASMASPVMQGNPSAQDIDPSLLPYMAQAAPMPMQMPMPFQQMAYQPSYGVQPVNYMPAYYPAYQPYPAYYYPQPVAPYNGYGYGYGY